MRSPRSLNVALPLALVALFAVSACGTNSKNSVAPAKSSLSLDGLIYNERYNCSQTFTGQPEFCADADISDQIQFTKTGPSSYTARDVPDTGYLYTGTTSDLTFTWTATSPNGYTESGTWTFSADGSTFSGHSNYVANDNSYSGECRETGALAPATPAAPPAIGSCP